MAARSGQALPARTRAPGIKNFVRRYPSTALGLNQQTNAWPTARNYLLAVCAEI
jgi:hypothetical protein